MPRCPFVAAIGTLTLTAVAFSGSAIGQVPLLGRWQEFAYSAQEVEAQAAKDYDARIALLRTKGKLNDDAQLVRRIRQISDGLVTQAVSLKPAARAWSWEFHTTSDTAYEAESAAGGKLLFGSAYVERLRLTDGELATLIAHEIAHAIAEHQREELSEVFYLNRASLPYR